MIRNIAWSVSTAAVLVLSGEFVGCADHDTKTVTVERTTTTTYRQPRHGEVVVVDPPPQEIVEAVPTGQHADDVWVRGHYVWDGRRYIWEPGHYVRVPRAGATWEPGRWERVQGGYVWVEGHWR